MPDQRHTAPEGASERVITRLTPQDASFYRLESSSNPIHIGSLAILNNSSPDTEGQVLDYERLVDLVESRLPMVPRYRRKVREIPLAMGRPVWVEDSRFDISYHIRRSALPGPGSDSQLYDLVARLASRPLDQGRPLWEMYLIEGLADGRAAVFTKSHSALVDGDTALEIGHVILDNSPLPRELADDAWRAPREPTDVELLVGALSQLAAQPREAYSVMRDAGSNAFGVVRGTRMAVKAAANVVRAATASAAPDSPLNARTSRNRRFDVVRTDLDDYRTIRRHFDCSINDAMLAVVTGALRNWLLSRGEPLIESTTAARGGADVGLRRRRQSADPGQRGVLVPHRPAGGGAEPGDAAVAHRACHRGHGQAASRVAGAHAGAAGRVRAREPACDECAGGEYLRRQQCSTW